MLTTEQSQLIGVLRSLVNLSDDEVAKVANLFQCHTLKRGDFFVRAGDAPRTIGFIEALHKS